MSPGGLEHLLGRLDRDVVDVDRDVEAGGPGNERHPAAQLDTRAGQGVAHLAGGPVGEIANRIEGLTGRSGSDEEIHGGGCTGAG